MHNTMKGFALASLLLLFTQSITAFSVNNLKAPTGGKTWALLVAGSNGYYNYRHQADICHAYHVLSAHGIPDEQIIVMMYDDIANADENPTKGIVINHPNGKDVYNGVLKDYTGDNVTPENFLRILQGQSQQMKGIGSGRVINSGPNDHVFVYFADHGAPGLVAFPEGELYATDLNKAIQNMHNQKRYGKMVFYIEACESGSMFDQLLPSNINVFATTAANPTESSYACYYDDKRQTYLGDLYSVNWMEDSDKENLNKETLEAQFNIVKQLTNLSSVQQYGDLTISNMVVSEFQGKKLGRFEGDLPTVPREAVSSREVPVMTVYRHLLKAEPSSDEALELKQKLNTMIKNRAFLVGKINDIVKKSTFTVSQSMAIHQGDYELTDFQCYNTVAKYFSKNCFSISRHTYSMQYLYLFVNMCENGIESFVQTAAMDEVCTFPAVDGRIE